MRQPQASGLLSIINRPAQLDLLDAASDTQFTVVTAPAGSGKTVLVRSWLEIRQPTGRHAWISVERGEQDPQRFWNTVVTEVSRMSAVDALVDEVVAAPGFNADLVISRLVAELDALGRADPGVR